MELITRIARIAGLSIIAYVTPLQGALYSILALVAVDLITGILVSRRNKTALSSKGIRATVLKLLIYELALVLAYTVEVYLTQGVIPLSRIVSTIIGMAELKSCYENLDLLSDVGLLRSIINALQARVSNEENKD